MAWVTKTETGRWKGRYRAPGGGTRSKTFDRKTDAQKWLRAELGRRDRREWVDPAMSKTTFADWLPRWEATRGNLAASTLAMQASLLGNHVEPWFGPWQLGAVTPTDMQAFVTDLGAKGLSASTVRQCYSIARSVFGTATDAGLITRTPARGVTLPRLPDQEMRAVDSRGGGDPRERGGPVSGRGAHCRLHRCPVRRARCSTNRPPGPSQAPPHGRVHALRCSRSSVVVEGAEECSVATPDRAPPVSLRRPERTLGRRSDERRRVRIPGAAGRSASPL